tara:strand:- start:445 stop:1077 length:633 start_codon:yes stop_codon:yes gene_type:complete
MGFLNKLFNKKTYNIKSNKMAEESKNIYVWIKSERVGKIAIEKEEKDGWLYFEDNSRINPKLVSEFLDLCPNMTIAKERSKILMSGSPENVILPGQKPIKVKEPETTVSISSKETSESMSSFDEDDLMVGILEKLSKKNKTNLDVSVGIKLPSKTIFKALQQDVDDDELRRGLEKLVKKQINNIEEQLNSQVEQFIQNYYYEQKRKKTSL